MTPRKKILAVFLAGVVLLCVGLSFWVGPRIANAIVQAADHLHAMGFFGGVIFAGIEFLVTLLGIVPGALLGIAAGAVYGVLAGFCFSATSILAGAVVAFGLSRSVMRPWIGRVLGRHARLTEFDGALAQEGWRIVALLRISPVMPFSVTSYALGFSRIGAADYILGTLASLPALLGYVVIGTLGRFGAVRNLHGDADIRIAILALGVLATLALTVHLSRLMARILKAG